MKSLVCSSDMLFQYFPAVDLITGFHFCQMINSFRNCCYFISWDTVSNMSNSSSFVQTISIWIGNILILLRQWKVIVLRNYYELVLKTPSVEQIKTNLCMFVFFLLWWLYVSKRKMSQTWNIFSNFFKNYLSNLSNIAIPRIEHKENNNNNRNKIRWLSSLSFSFT